MIGPIRDALENLVDQLDTLAQEIEHEARDLQRRRLTDDERWHVLALHSQAKGVRYALIVANGVNAGMPVGQTVRIKGFPADHPNAKGGVVCQPWEVELETDDEVEESHVHEDWTEMLAVTWEGADGKPWSGWEYISDLAPVHAPKS
jgi:hypothetical protein